MKETGTCMLHVGIDGTKVYISDNEGYGTYDRLFRTQEEADSCFEWTKDKLLEFRKVLVDKGWEISEPYEWGYDDD